MSSVKTLKSYVLGGWHEGRGEPRMLVDPSTEEPIAQIGSPSYSFADVIQLAVETGGPALRELSFKQRGDLLKGMSKALQEAREELIELSLTNTGATRKDAKFDIDGATQTLTYYGYVADELGESSLYYDGTGVALGRSAKFWGEHVRVPRQGVAVHINAFNFPAWGFAEKAACSLLAGMPVITKTATSSALVMARCVELIVEASLLPEGAFQFICGSTGDLIGRLGAQDVLAFTGSAETALKLKRSENLLESNATVNLEADSLNAAVIGHGVELDSETGQLFLRDVVREITQKSGQKCTAVRRIFVPEGLKSEVLEALSERLAETVTGNPRESSVTMGPLASRDQLDSAVAGIQSLNGECRTVFGTGERVEGVGAPEGVGFYFGPTLLEANDSAGATRVHELEVFGPVATVLEYSGSARAAAEEVAKGGGTLVTSLYSDDLDWVSDYVKSGAAYTGRLYLGAEKMAEQAMGSGLVMPQSVHGGPGRAGGGSELGGRFGLDLYTQRLALQGSRSMIERLYGKNSSDK